MLGELGYRGMSSGPGRLFRTEVNLSIFTTSFTGWRYVKKRARRSIIASGFAGLRRAKGVYTPFLTHGNQPQGHFNAMRLPTVISLVQKGPCPVVA